jgi:hypothetical protein
MGVSSRTAFEACVSAKEFRDVVETGPAAFEPIALDFDRHQPGLA